VKIVAIIARILLGLMFLVFGLNPLLKFLPMPPLEGVWGQFLGALVVSHYVWFVGAVQVISGALFLIGRYVPLAIALSGPVVANIIVYHLTMQHSGGTAGGSGNHMLGDSVLALPCFVCAPVGAKSLASDSTLLGCCGICVLPCVQTAKCFGNSVHTKRSELNLRCRATTATFRVVSVWPTIRSECESWLSAFSAFGCPLDAQ
jgi:putative oxidoreductase